MPGVVFLVHVSNGRSPGEVEEDAEVLMRVKARDGSSTAEIIEPLRTKGLRLLQVQRNMWIYRPTMKKPVAISPRQRLSGQASLGDTASTGYARDHVATYLRRDNDKGEASHVLDLTAGSTSTTYDRIIYWVSERTGTASARSPFRLRQADQARRLPVRSAGIWTLGRHQGLNSEAPFNPRNRLINLAPCPWIPHPMAGLRTGGGIPGCPCRCGRSDLRPCAGGA